MKLTAKQLRYRVNPKTLTYTHSSEPSEIGGILGQPRASQALEFGLAIDKPGYNIYVGGEDRTSRIRNVLKYLDNIAGQQETPPDWIYVNNFDNPMTPRIFSLPPRQGIQFKHHIDLLISALLNTFPACFDNPGYQQNKNILQSGFEKTYEEAITTVKQAAYKMNIAMYNDIGTVTFTPIIDGKALDEDQFASLNQAQMNTFNQQVTELETLLNEALLELPIWQRDLNENLRKLRENTITQALKPILHPLRQAYQSHTAVSLFLAQINKHLPRVIEEHLADNDASSNHQDLQKRKILEGFYHPNILTSAIVSGAPVIMESNPNHQNLFGRVSYGSDEANSAFQQITPGTLHRANGGYLILEIDKLLTGDYTWAGLKRMLRDELIYSEPPPGEIQVGGASPLRPEPIPLSLKIILIGSREIYYRLVEIDRDFNELFRVLVDFEGYFDSSAETVKQFCELLHTRAQEVEIASITQNAAARLIEHAHRIAEHQQRLTAQLDAIVDVAVEADFIRSKRRDKHIDLIHINEAIHARRHRNARLRDQLLKDIIEQTVVISSEGKAVGQINGLSVLQVGDSLFGCPTRITATVHPGHRGVIDIEREAELGRAVHTKGVMILTGYLCSYYTQELPLAISAHIAMEQTYGYIDGDSASLAEFCALLSALVGTPLRQDLAITGSINQRGEIQAVGGINEKVECFFDLCKARGLTGTQGVLLPHSNSNNLMLSERVVTAVQENKFSVFTVTTVNEALELLTGETAGEPDEHSNFPQGTLNHKVVTRLNTFARLTRSIQDTNHSQ